MTRTLLALGACCAVLLALVFARARGANDGRAAAQPLEKLIALADAQRTRVAALSLEAPGRDVHWLLARSKGRWRVREAFGAFADEELVQELLAALLDARGIVVEERQDAGALASLGFAREQLVTLGLHGPKVLDAPDRDLIASVELGARVRGAPGRFARRGGGDPRVLELDRDLGRFLGTLAPGELPPLVDRHLIAGALESGALGLRRMTSTRRDGSVIEIARAAESGDEQAGPPRWTISASGSAPRECPVWRAGGYMGAWMRGLAQGFAPSSRAAELGLDAPFARVRLEPDRGAPIELAIGDLEPDRSAYVWNRATNVLMRIDATLHAQLAPDVEAFLDLTRPNPWEIFLQSRAPR